MIIHLSKIKAYYDPKRKKAFTSWSFESDIKRYKNIDQALKDFNKLGKSQKLNKIVNSKNLEAYVYRLSLSFDLFKEVFNEELQNIVNDQGYIKA